MASSQLDAHTPQGSNGMTVCLSDKARVIAHSALKYKSGYITVSRYSGDLGKWRNVHIAKKSLEKLIPASTNLLEALKKQELYYVSLTKKQLMMTTKFEKPGRETLHFISILHPKTEQENLNAQTEYNHGKTINLNLQEYEKLHASLEKLLEVTKTPRATPDNDAPDAEEQETLTGYRWIMHGGGKRTNSIFLTRDECEKNVRSYIEHLPEDVKQLKDFHSYQISPIIIVAPSKIEIIEHIVYNEVVKNSGYTMTDLCMEPPSESLIEDAIQKLSKNEIIQISATIAAMLGHKRLYFLSDIYDIFLYGGGINKVRQALLEYVTPPSSKAYIRLLDTCYQNVVKCGPVLDIEGKPQPLFPPTEVCDIEV